MAVAAKEQLKSWRGVDLWLRSKGFRADAVAERESSDHTPVGDILQGIETLQNVWGLPAATSRDLRFFVPQDCRLFEDSFEQQLRTDATLKPVRLQDLSGQLRADTIERLTKAAVESLNNIIQGEDLPLSSLTQGGIGGIKGMQRLVKFSLQDLEIVANYFRLIVDLELSDTVAAGGAAGATGAITPRRSTGPVAARVNVEATTKERTDRLKAAVELLQLSEVLPKAAKVLEEFKLIQGGSNSDLQRLGGIATRIGNPSNHSNIKLREVIGLVKEVKDHSHGLEIHHLKLIGCLIECNQLFLFIQSEPDISGQIGKLTQDMQGDPVKQAVLNNLNLSRDFLCDVFPGLISPDEVPGKPFNEFVNKLIEGRRSEEVVNELISALQSSARHIAEISTWFRGAGGAANPGKIVRIVATYLREGHFVARSPRCEGGAGLELLCGGSEGSLQFRVTDVRLQEEVS